MKQYRDFYFRKAKAENYPARSVYKLQELDAKFGLLRRDMKILDLGAAPGSWTLGCAQKIGPCGTVLACDLQPVNIELPQNALFFQSDIFNPSPEFAAALGEMAPFHAVISDMAPATTGSRFTDQARSFQLARAAWELALTRLRPGGSFVVKIFMGPDVQELLTAMRGTFHQVKTFKPKSSRSESRETFLVGLGFQAANQ